MFHSQQSSEKASQTTSCAAATTWQAKFRQGVFPKPGRPIRKRVILLSRLFNESVETVHKLEKRAVQETAKMLEIERTWHVYDWLHEILKYINERSRLLKFFLK